MAHAWLLILLPLFGAGYLAWQGRHLREEQIGTIAAGAVGGSFVIAVLCWLQVYALRGGPVDHLIAGGPSWLAVGKLTVDYHLLLDPLSTVMTLVVTGVGLVIHLYARGYMHGDPHFPRFFALLNLFIAAMLVLVLGENLALLFVGWEGVGFCSYMLIGYFTEKQSASQAGKKAFIVNRIGDLGFLLGSFLLYRATGTLSLPEIVKALPAEYAVGNPQLTAAALCFFVGACGKSAQFPLYIWLPDAMEGPTPVSALIHAATMVTAGVYLTVRLSVLYALSPFASQVVAVIGVLTALLAALLALVQHDIKKVLAYSTVSQLGFMFLAVGVGAYAAAIFHLVTHAFFKGLLFLCSGSVIHAMEHALHHAHESGDPQDMRQMGGLREKLPQTHWTMLIGGAAIAGLPPLAGFFSKDEILLHAGQGHLLLWAVATGVALLTAFYNARLLYKTFWQPTRMSAAAYAAVEENGPTLILPLQILAGLAALGGLLNLPGHGLCSQQLARFLDPVTAPALHVLGAHHPFTLGQEVRGMLFSVGVVMVGLGLAAWGYREANQRMGQLAARYPRCYRPLVNLYGLDEFYQRWVVRPGHQCAEWLAREFDAGVIDGLVNGVGSFFSDSAEFTRRYQPGLVRSYALWFTLGAVGLLAALALRPAPAVVQGVVGGLLLLLAGGTVWVMRPRSEA
ncbi:MAG: NADH-quinone oxidoreductase subunit L [Fimbriimonadaceae bacterium]|nr:NADH-quinone oxidoreductase subunit L [Fimbriimonadaceae bacterium]